MDVVLDDFPMDSWEPISEDEVSYIVAGPQDDVPMDVSPFQKREKESDEALSITPMDSKTHHRFEESITKKWQKQGEASDTTLVAEK